MGAVPREFLLAAVAMAVLAAGVVLLVTGSSVGWVLVAAGALLDAVAVVLILRRAAGRSRLEPPPMPGMVDRR